MQKCYSSIGGHLSGSSIRDVGDANDVDEGLSYGVLSPGHENATQRKHTEIRYSLEAKCEV